MSVKSENQPDVVVLSRTSDGETKIKVDNRLYLVLGMSDWVFRKFEQIRSKSSGKAIAWLTKTVPEDSIQRIGSITQEHIMEKVERELDLNSPIPRDVVDQVYKGGTNSTGVTDLAEGAVIACLENVNPEDKDELCSKLRDKGYKYSIIPIEDKLEIVYYEDANAALDPVGLRMRDIGLGVPLSAIEHGRLATALGASEDTVIAIVERVAKAFAAYCKQDDGAMGGDSTPSGEGKATDVSKQNGIDEHCLDSLSWTATFETRTQAEAFVDYVRVLSEEEGSDYRDEWIILDDDARTVFGLCMPTKLVDLALLVNENKGDFSYDLNPEMDEPEDEEEEGLEPGMVRCEVDFEGEGDELTFIIDFEDETHLELGGADAKTLMSEMNVDEPEELVELSQIPREYYLDASSEDEFYDPEGEPQVGTDADEFMGEADKKKGPYTPGFHLAQARKKGLLPQRGKGPLKRARLSPVKVGGIPVKQLEPAAQDAELSEHMELIEAMKSMIAEARRELASLVSDQEDMEYHLSRLMNSLGRNEVTLGSLTATLERVVGEPSIRLNYADALSRVFETNTVLYEELLRFLTKDKEAPERKQSFALDVKKTEALDPMDVFKVAAKNKLAEARGDIKALKDLLKASQDVNTVVDDFLDVIGSGVALAASLDQDMPLREDAQDFMFNLNNVVQKAILDGVEVNQLYAIMADTAKKLGQDVQRGRYMQPGVVESIDAMKTKDTVYVIVDEAIDAGVPPEVVSDMLQSMIDALNDTAEKNMIGLANAS